MKYLIPLLLLSTAAVAQQSRCGSGQEIHDMLSNDYHEKPFVEMKDNQDRQFIMYVNPDSGTWTVVQLTESGLLCGISAGKGFTPAITKRYETTDPKKKEIPG
jgi:hypothetical protein